MGPISGHHVMPSVYANITANIERSANPAYNIASYVEERKKVLRKMLIMIVKWQVMARTPTHITPGI